MQSTLPPCKTINIFIHWELHASSPYIVIYIWSGHWWNTWGADSLDPETWELERQVICSLHTQTTVVSWAHDDSNRFLFKKRRRKQVAVTGLEELQPWTHQPFLCLWGRWMCVKLDLLLLPRSGSHIRCCLYGHFAALSESLSFLMRNAPGCGWVTLPVTSCM